MFVIDLFRDVTALHKRLGPTLSGILCSDRWSAYDHVELLRRQICWAHLKRNRENLSERGGNLMGIATDVNGDLIATSYTSPSFFERINPSNGTSFVVGQIDAGTFEDHGGDIQLASSATPEPSK